VVSDSPNPVDYSHRLHLHGLLSWQARRTALDQWNSDDNSKVPYYRAAGSLYMDDAQSLLPQVRFPKLAKGAAEKAKGLNALLEEKVNLEWTWRKQGNKDWNNGPAQLGVTTEPKATLKYRLDVSPVDKSVLGYAVAWRHAPEQTAADSKQMAELLGRQLKVGV